MVSERRPGGPWPPGAWPGALVLAHDAVMTSRDRALYDQFVATCRCDENDVAEVRLNEHGFEVDVVDFTDADWPVRTFIIDT